MKSENSNVKGIVSDIKKENMYSVTVKVFWRTVGVLLSLLLLVSLFLDNTNTFQSLWLLIEDVNSDFNIIKYMFIPVAFLSLVACIFCDWKNIRIVGIAGLLMFGFYFWIVYGYSRKFDSSMFELLGMFRFGSYIRLLCPLIILVFSRMVLKNQGKYITE